MRCNRPGCRGVVSEIPHVRERILVGVRRLRGEGHRFADHGELSTCGRLIDRGLMIGRPNGKRRRGRDGQRDDGESRDLRPPLAACGGRAGDGGVRGSALGLGFGCESHSSPRSCGELSEGQVSLNTF